MQSALLNWSFDTVAFLLFLIPVFFLYWASTLLPWPKQAQNTVLVLSGVVFYAVLQWQYLVLLAGSGLLAFYLAQFLVRCKTDKGRYRLAALGVFLHVGLLFFFKYSTAVSNTLLLGLVKLGVSVSWHLPVWALPLGISFFTFQLVAYWIDVYQENIEPETDLLAFLAYLFFFPKLLSGPIARVQQLMPQLHDVRSFNADLASEGLRQWVWGLFKKRIISDVASVYVLGVFNGESSPSGGDLWLACLLFPLQLYADFSGYTDMALGISKLFGLRLMPNFNYPFFARNIRDYWQRWHISLTSWMMDYVYTPCSFALRRKGKLGVVLSILLTFSLVGIWHGAKWTYLVFGVVQSVYFLPMILFPNGLFNIKTPAWLDRILLYLLVSVTSVIMLSDTMQALVSNYSIMFSSFQFERALGDLTSLMFVLPVLALMGLDYISLEAEFPLHSCVIKKPLYRRMLVITIVVVLFYVRNEQVDFLYFQF